MAVGHFLLFHFSSLCGRFLSHLMAHDRRMAGHFLGLDSFSSPKSNFVAQQPICDCPCSRHPLSFLPIPPFSYISAQYLNPVWPTWDRLGHQVLPVSVNVYIVTEAGSSSIPVADLCIRFWVGNRRATPEIILLNHISIPCPLICEHI